MFYIYFLRSLKDNGFYIGRTNNLERRFLEHTNGRVPSTKSRRPLELLGYEACEIEEDSVVLEREWKKGYKREELIRRYGE